MSEQRIKRGRGRPRGSKNKPKPNKPPVVAESANQNVWEPAYGSFADAALLSGMSHWWWRKQERLGTITVVRLGPRKVLVPLSEVKRVLAEGTKPRKPPVTPPPPVQFPGENRATA